MKRFLTISSDYKAEIITKGNFSRVIIFFPSHPKQFFVFSLFLLDLFFEFENQLGLKILNWEVQAVNNGRGVLEGWPIIIHHEPKEKARIAHLPEAEPDIGL